MSKLEELIEKYTADIEAAGEKADKAILTAVAKGLGPSIYRADASLVAASDPSEVDRMKQNFCVKKLGCKDTPALDATIKEVFQVYNKRQKHRAVVYYLLAKKLKKTAVYKS
ncbi:MAG TPA: DUF2853 family protein [Bacteroidia bacterium]|nr:DUF2853 family protein [Bacteroidia bacterium]